MTSARDGILGQASAFSAEARVGFRNPPSQRETLGTLLTLTPAMLSRLGEEGKKRSSALKGLTLFLYYILYL